MTVLDRDSLISVYGRSSLASGGSVTPASLVAPDEVRQHEQAWESVIDDKLIAWGLSPEQFDEEGIEAPSHAVLSRAAMLAAQLRDAQCSAPDFVRPDASGGIVFEKRKAGDSLVLHIWDDLTVELQLFSGSNLIERHQLDVD